MVCRTDAYASHEVDYEGEMVTKYYNVYLPAGYDQEDAAQKYNVFYLMHGGGENENTLFGGPAQELALKKIIDNMIENDDMEPMIGIMQINIYIISCQIYSSRLRRVPDDYLQVRKRQK